MARPKTSTETTLTPSSVLVVTEGSVARMEIGPRMETPGYPTFLQFTPWDMIPVGVPGSGKPLCCILLTPEWYENYIANKTIHEWLNTYDKLLAYFEKSPSYRFGCAVCGYLLDTVEDYRAHLTEHKRILKDL